VHADKINHLRTGVQNGDRRALARAITVVEADLPGAAGILKSLSATDAARVVGLTGPPGAGKSTLANALVHHWVGQGLRVAVLAVDPSSPFHLGALLGDRIRLAPLFTHPSVFIRSLASRGALGGLHPRMLEVVDVVKEAGYNRILVETVGVGQSEVDVAGLADCTVVALVPEAGDTVQTMKAGLLEVAQILVVNKSDRDGAEEMAKSLRMMAHEAASHDRPEAPVVKTTASTGDGVAALAAAIDAHLDTGRPATSERRLHLLAVKTLRIVQDRHTTGLTPTKLKALLEVALQKPDFNLYAFAEGLPVEGWGA